MQKPPLPDDEPERLAELHGLGILDTPPEERFDRYTRLVKRLLGVDMALVSLVDANRQWFKSRQGLDAEQTPREISFCGHGILGRDVFVVEDAIADERFHDNPLVTGDPNLRFYAGYPLPGPNGCNVGTLCVLDRAPRTLTADDLQTLREIGELVAAELASLELATTDELTGLSNRRGFEMLAQQVMAIVARHHQSVTVVMMDLNGFKQINDDYGHDAGDQALIEFAGLLLKTFRQSDVVGRYAGDEFIVLLTETSLADAEIAIRRLLESVRCHNAARTDVPPIDFSWGLAAYDPEAHANIWDALQLADRAMLAQKRENPLARTRERHPDKNAQSGSSPD